MPADTTTLEAVNMTRLQKLAALLIILGPESAAHLLKNFDEQELEAVTREMSGLSVISWELQDEILAEFGGLAVDAAGVPGGAAYARKALEKSVGPGRATDILNRVTPAPANVATQQIAGLDPRELCHLLAQEQPQTVALVASCLPPEKCSQFLLLLPGGLRDQVVERLATLAPTPVEVIERILAVLNRKAASKPARALNHTGGLKNAAEVLKSIGGNLGQSVLSELEKRNPELGQAIRERMFTFEDLALLDARSLQAVMREVDMRDLAISILDAPEPLQRSLLSGISRRAAETVREEIAMLGPQRPRDIQAARRRIAEIARRLEGLEDSESTAVKSRDELLV
jgi:flagellar motor switch protein FliG